MADVVKAKFQQNPDLLQQLLDTGDAQIVEGNHHLIIKEKSSIERK